MEAKETLKLIGENWFLTEPAYFALYCKQLLQENVNMECALRCGQGRIEYNPLILKHKNYQEAEQLMRIELIRLYLKHPYERRPEGCGGKAIALGSDITIADGYCTLHKEKLPLQTPDYYHLPIGQYYEWYAKQLQQQEDNENESSAATNRPMAYENESLQDKSALWEDDSLQRQLIDELIERTTDWGTMPADFVECIQASTKTHLRNHLVWLGFHGVVLKNQRQLTRMRPNRRTGFLQMGSSRQYNTHLLVAIDVSGSVDDSMLADFYGTINHQFNLSNLEMSLCQFDVELGPIVPYRKRNKQVIVKGRGGTSFQPLIDYVSLHREYDGLMILTDGKAPAPKLPRYFITPILWVCHNRGCYEQNKDWMRESGRVCHL